MSVPFTLRNPVPSILTFVKSSYAQQLLSNRTSNTFSFWSNYKFNRKFKKYRERLSTGQSDPQDDNDIGAYSRASKPGSWVVSSPDFTWFTCTVCVCVCVCACAHAYICLWNLITCILPPSQLRYRTVSSPQSYLSGNLYIVAPSPALALLAIANLFSISVILSFQECYISESIHFVTFWDWLFESAQVPLKIRNGYYVRHLTWIFPLKFHNHFPHQLGSVFDSESWKREHRGL